MCPSTSVAVSYRTLQAVHDLQSLAKRAGEGTLNRVASGLPGAVTGQEIESLIVEDGCRLSPEMADRVHQGLVLAATLPSDDHEAFLTSTAILLADRLQKGAGTDDLFWHWDAFHSHYVMLDAPDRSAIMQGYRRAHEEGYVALFDPPEGDVLTTEHGSEILELLVGFAKQAQPHAGSGQPAFAREFATLIARALDDKPAATEAARIWTSDSGAILKLPEQNRLPLLRGLRHLYEWREDWQPYLDQTFDPRNPGVHLLPTGRR